MEEKLANHFEVLKERLGRIENRLSNIFDNQNSNQEGTSTNNKTIDLAVAITGLKKKTIYNFGVQAVDSSFKAWEAPLLRRDGVKRMDRKGKRKTLEELGIKNRRL